MQVPVITFPVDSEEHPKAAKLLPGEVPNV